MFYISIKDSEVRELPDLVLTRTKAAISRATDNAYEIVLNNTQMKLHIRTGALHHSIKKLVTGNDLNTLRGRVWTSTSYAPIHETGGIIRAKNKYMNVPGGPYLHIPLNYNKTKMGIMRFNAGQIFATGGYIARSKLGNWIVFSDSNKPMFALKKMVKIPPRVGMQVAQEEVMPQLLYDLDHILD